MVFNSKGASILSPTEVCAFDWVNIRKGKYYQKKLSCFKIIFKVANIFFLLRAITHLLS